MAKGFTSSQSTLVKSALFLFSLIFILGFVSAATLNVHSAQLSTTTSIESGAFSDASLNSGIVTLEADKHASDWSDASEARITIQASDVGITTLSDLTDMSWNANVISGYLPHVDVYLDLNNNGVYDSGIDDVLVFEYAKVNNNNCDNAPYPTGSLVTFDDKGDLSDSSYAWLNSGDPGNCGSPTYYAHSLGDWKNSQTENGKIIDGNTKVLRLELEIDAWISDSESEVSNIIVNGVPYYTSIQDAINAAFPDDTINIAAGTYPESILIDKSLTLIGENKPIISGFGTNYIVKITTNNVIFDNFEINGGGSGIGDNAFDYGIWLSNTDNVEIANSNIKNIWQGSSNGIQVDDSTNSKVHDNTISFFHKRGIRYVNSDGVFHDNEVTGESVNGVDRVQNLVTLWTGSDVEIYNNILHNALTLVGPTPLWDSPGIFVSSYYGGYADSSSSYANIHNNEIYNGDTGIVITSVYSTTDTSSADITNNNFHDLNWAINFEKETGSAILHNNKFANINMAVSAENNDGLLTLTSTIDATQNYWGTNDETIIQGLVAEDVDYDPWYVDDTLTVLHSIPTDNGDGTESTTLSTETQLTNSANDIEAIIPAGTTITADSIWDGTISAPTIELMADVAPSTAGFTSTVSTVVEVGFSGIQLTFDKAVKLVISGEAGKLVGYTYDGATFTQITTLCDDLNAPTNVNPDCYIDDGSDLVIWTKHFTQFVTYTQTANPITTLGGGGEPTPNIVRGPPGPCLSPSGCPGGADFGKTESTPTTLGNTPTAPTTGFFAGITGAVIGALGSPTGIVSIIFIVVLVGLMVVLKVGRKGKKEEKE